MRRHGAAGGLLLADLMMILTALFFGLSVTSWIKWTWFLISCAAFGGVFYVLWVSLLRENATERGDVQASYRRNAAVLSVLWPLYPLVLLVGTNGLGVIGSTASVALIAILNLVFKVGFGLIVTASHAKAVDRDLAGRSGGSSEGRPEPVHATRPILAAPRASHPGGRLSWGRAAVILLGVPYGALDGEIARPYLLPRFGRAWFIAFALP